LSKKTKKKHTEKVFPKDKFDDPPRTWLLFDLRIRSGTSTIATLAAFNLAKGETEPVFD